MVALRALLAIRNLRAMIFEFIYFFQVPSRKRILGAHQTVSVCTYLERLWSENSELPISDKHHDIHILMFQGNANEIPSTEFFRVCLSHTAMLTTQM